MDIMSWRLCTLAAVLAIAQQFLADPPISGGDDNRPQLKPQPVQCEWAPVERQLPDQADCGMNDLSGANPGLFECGSVSDGVRCVEKCVFKRCMGP